MAVQRIDFIYYPGVFGDAFPKISATLEGSWDEQGRYSDTWSVTEMDKEPSPDGGYCFKKEIALDTSQFGATFKWGVRFRDQESGKTTWAIPTEVKSTESRERFRNFEFDSNTKSESYYLTTARFLGANKYKKSDGDWAACFRVWAPNAENVELVFGNIWDIDARVPEPAGPDTSIKVEKIAGGYIADDGTGIHKDLPKIPMQKIAEGIWETLGEHDDLQDLTMLEHRLYMYRIQRADEDSRVYRTDLYSRCQAGFGTTKPEGQPYDGLLGELAGAISCSVTVDPEKVVKDFDVPVWPEPKEKFISTEEFWKDEFTDKSLPNRVEDLVIYELHLGALGFGSDEPGTIKDAIDLLDHISELNVNAIELLPLSEFAGAAENWGYATSHYFAIEYSGGGRDKFKHFVKQCHKRGIAVIMDVVFNHYDHHAERAQRHYDSTKPEQDFYYWYEGQSADYRYLKEEAKPGEYWLDNWQRGGYVDNYSTGDAPAYHQELVRKMFISSAVVLMEEFHVDGFRVDQTTSMHEYNKLRASGSEVGAANIFGAKFLRELGRTLRLFRPNVFLMAEDHSDWDEVTSPVEQGGMGFDLRWYADYYHHLAGDTNSDDKAKLLYNASVSGSDAALNMEWFAGALWGTQFKKVVFNESHDEAGNSRGPVKDCQWNRRDEDKEYTSHRTIVVAVSGAHLVDNTRKYAEARCRFAWGITVLSAGTPMFLFGEEVGAEKRFKYGDVLRNKEDLQIMRMGSGRNLYRFYSEVNALRLKRAGLRSRNIEIIHVSNENRVIVFKRWEREESYLVFASLSDTAFGNGYVVEHTHINPGEWVEIFNSDSAAYGGENVGNLGRSIRSSDGRFEVVLPFCGVVVFQYKIS